MTADDNLRRAAEAHIACHDADDDGDCIAPCPSLETLCAALVARSEPRDVGGDPYRRGYSEGLNAALAQMPYRSEPRAEGLDAAFLHRWTCRTGSPHNYTRIDGYSVPVCEAAERGIEARPRHAPASGVSAATPPAERLDVERAIRIMREDGLWPDDGYWADAAYRGKDGVAEVARWIREAALAPEQPE